MGTNNNLTPEQTVEHIIQDKAIEIINKPENIKLLAVAMQELFDKDPAQFYNKWVSPRLPKIVEGIEDIEFVPQTTIQEAESMDETTSPKQTKQDNKNIVNE